MELLDSPIRDYAWGSRSVLALLQGRPSPSPGPEAELWVGAHPGAPSTLDGEDGPVSLADAIAAAPTGWLGADAVARFGPRLPFLLKVLAAEAPLSLQAHPDLARARERFAAGDANYVDANHKPELLVAIEPFEALCGFRDPQRSADALEALGGAAVAPVVTHLRRGDLRKAVELLLTWPGDGAELVALVAGLDATSQPDADTGSAADLGTSSVVGTGTTAGDGAGAGEDTGVTAGLPDDAAGAGSAVGATSARFGATAATAATAATPATAGTVATAATAATPATAGTAAMAATPATAATAATSATTATAATAATAGSEVTAAAAGTEATAATAAGAASDGGGRGAAARGPSSAGGDTADGRFDADLRLVRWLAGYYPTDPGVLVALLLNPVTLRPGEAVWMPAGNLHSYLRGAGVEIMAASDNVLRGGLTPKRVDVAELLRVLRFEVLLDPVVKPVDVAPGVVTWPAPVDDFALYRVTGPAELDLDGPVLVLCTAGVSTIGDTTGVVSLTAGRAAVGPAGAGPVMIAGAGEVFVAALGGRG